MADLAYQPADLIAALNEFLAAIRSGDQARIDAARAAYLAVLGS